MSDKNIFSPPTYGSIETHYILAIKDKSPKELNAYIDRLNKYDDKEILTLIFKRYPDKDIRIKVGKILYYN